MAGAGPHRRRNPLTGEWVLVAPQRLQRPWQGMEEPPEPRGPAFDPACYLCPGNRRASGAVNPDYRGVHIFNNDFPALTAEAGDEGSDDPLFTAAAARGVCRVICYSPDHSRTLPELQPGAVAEVVDGWCSEAEALGREFASVTVFENKGAMMGCSNPHPHGQIWASTHVPGEVVVEDGQQRAFAQAHGRPLLEAVVERELGGGRVVVATEHWLAIVPFWAAWPFETLLLPRGSVARLPELDGAQRADLARALVELTTRYDNLFKTSFPYTMGWHGAPFGMADARHWRLHAHFYPPLLRSASVRKFMVGYEMLAEPQRDLPPEAAAERLRAVSATHFREGA